jgi:hypothetical protein
MLKDLKLAKYIVEENGVKFCKSLITVCGKNILKINPYVIRKFLTCFIHSFHKI